VPFQRIRDAKSREGHEVTAVLPTHNAVSLHYISSLHILIGL
jgi:hypothetical protein